VKRRDGTLLRGHKHLASAPVELHQVAKAASCTNRVLHHLPEAFDGVEVMSAVDRQEMEATRALLGRKCRVKLVRPMDPTAIDDHDDIFAGFAEGRHDLMARGASFLSITVGHEFREDFRGAILHGADDAESHTAGDTTPCAVLQPRLTLATLLLFYLALAQRACGQAITLGAAPPAQPGQGKAPQDRFIFIEQDELTSTCSVLQSGEFKRAIGEISRGRIEPSRRTAVTSRVFLRHRGRVHGPAGYRSVGPAPWRVRDHSTGKSGSHAGGGLDRQGD
jgi:hypothetical protein